MHNILWIDDEHQKLGGLKVIAKSKYGLLIHGVDNYKDGINWLKNHSTTCRAVILDIECKETRNTSVAIEAFDDWSEITRLCAKYNDIPWFVYTGLDEEDIPSDIRGALNFVAKGRNEKPFYIKSVDNVWEKVHDVIENTLEGQLEKKYSEIFEFVGDDGREKLLRVMLSIADNNTKNTSCMNDMRQVLEWLINHLKDYGMLQKDCKLSNASCCIDEYSKCGLDAIPRYIGVTLQACENATQEGSHDGTNDDILVTKDLVAGKAPYLIESTLNNLLTILYWAMNLPKENDGREEFVQYLLSVADFEFCTEAGIVEEKDGVYYVDNCKLLCKNKYQFSKIVGRYVKIISYGDNRHNDRYKYPYFSYNYQVIEDYE